MDLDLGRRWAGATARWKAAGWDRATAAGLARGTAAVWAQPWAAAMERSKAET